MDVLLSQLLGAGGADLAAGAAGNTAALSLVDNNGQSVQGDFANLLTLLLQSGGQVAGQQVNANTGPIPVSGITDTSLMQENTANMQAAAAIEQNALEIENTNTDSNLTSLLAALYAAPLPNSQIPTNPNLEQNGQDIITSAMEANDVLLGGGGTDKLQMAAASAELQTQEILPALQAQMAAEAAKKQQDNATLLANAENNAMAANSLDHQQVTNMAALQAQLEANKASGTVAVDGENIDQTAIKVKGDAASGSGKEIVSQVVQALQDKNGGAPLPLHKVINAKLDKDSQNQESASIVSEGNIAKDNNQLGEALQEVSKDATDKQLGGRSNEEIFKNVQENKIDVTKNGDTLPVHTKNIELSHHLSSNSAEVNRPVLQGNQALMPIDQVRVHVLKALENGEKFITVQLHPAELGRIDVRMGVGADGVTHITISADRQDTLDLLRKDSSQLERSLSDNGIKTDSGGLSFSLRDGNDGQQQRRSAYEQFAKMQGTLFANNSNETQSEILYSYTGYVRQDRLDVRV